MRVILTRSLSEARPWAKALQARGLDTLALPLIVVETVAEPQAVHAAWGQLDRCRAAMFVSANAVRFFFAERPAGLSWPTGTRAWATGPATSERLAEAGVPVGLIDAPALHAPQFDSETLWQRTAAQVASGDRVLIVRGGDARGTGRDWLAGQLSAAGAQVEAVVAYVRRPPAFSALQLAQARQAAAGSGIWLFSSSQAIDNLRGLLPAQRWDQARALATHPRIAQAARTAGFGVVCESRPSLDAVVTALESFR